MEKLIGKEAKLPDGQNVVIEEVDNGFASVRRIDGEWKGKLAVCSVSSLEIRSTELSQ